MVRADGRGCPITCRSILDQTVATMTTWDIQRLRGLAKHIYGARQLETISPHIDSVDWKIRIASFHAYSARHAFDQVLGGDQRDLSMVFARMFSTGAERNTFMDAKIAYEAHVIACAQAMHSVADILARVVAIALSIPLPSSGGVTFDTIKAAIPPGPLKDSVTGLRGLKPFCYMRDFVNQTKHVSLVFSAYTLDLTGEDSRAHGLRFNSFSAGKSNHPQKWGEDILQELAEVAKNYVAVGRQLNAFLEGLVGQASDHGKGG